MSQSISIPRTAALRGRILTRLKFIFGKPVVIGESYDDCHAMHGFTPPAVYKVRHYDDREKLVMLESIDHRIIMFVSGDMAVWKDELYVDDVYTVLHTDAAIDEIINDYASANGIDHMTVETATSALMTKFCKLGQTMCKRIASAVVSAEK